MKPTDREDTEGAAPETGWCARPRQPRDHGADDLPMDARHREASAPPPPAGIA